MFIQTEATPNPLTMKFIPGMSIMAQGTVYYTAPEQAKTSPQTIQAILGGTGSEQRIAILRQHGVEYMALPAWQRHGSAVYMSQEDGKQPQLVIDLRLPDAASYPDYLARHLV